VPKAVISFTRIGFLRGVFLANQLASNDNLTRTTRRQNKYKCKLTLTQKVAGINSRKHIQKTCAKREDRQSLV